MMKKIQEELRKIMNSHKQTVKNPQIELLKAKMNSIMNNKQKMNESGENESYNYEAGQK